MRCSIVVVAVMALGGGCHKDSVGDCAGVIGRAFDRMVKDGVQQGVAEHGGQTTPEVQREIDRMSGAMVASVAPVKAAMIQACKDDHWSAGALACIDSVHGGDALGSCDDKLTSAQNQHLEKMLAEAQGKTGSDAPAACQRYADFEIKCNDAGDDARPTILEFCTKARAGAKEATYQLIALESRCAETATDCASYQSCVEEKKRDTSPL